jgi:hypothetical protein
VGKAARLKREWISTKAGSTRSGPFWHGGVSGLPLGTVLLPGGGAHLAQKSARGSTNSRQ